VRSHKADSRGFEKVRYNSRHHHRHHHVHRHSRHR
jgi:hypothetical protein